MKSDEELITAVLKGESAAFEQMVRRHERSLRAIAFYVLHDLHLAEDAVQDAFVAAYRALPGLRNPQTFGAWMAQIVRRQALALAAARVQTVPLDHAAELPASGDALDVDSEKLLAAVMKLPEPERFALMLRQFDGHDMAAIAQITGESVGTISKRISRAHDRLRDLLKEHP